MDVEVSVRPLVIADLDWVVDLSARRGEQRQPFAPRFWRRAPDARDVHAGYLRSLIEDPSVSAMRTDHTFAIAVRGSDSLLIDDAATEQVGLWATEGVALFKSLVAGSKVRFVCPVPEPQRAWFAVDLGLVCAETWWHRDLVSGSGEDHRTGASLRTPRAWGRLVAAPPVYAPGGPVLLVTRFHDRESLAELEQHAASRGAVVSIVTQSPGDAVDDDLLPAIGYRRTCEFYEGTVR